MRFTNRITFSPQAQTGSHTGDSPSVIRPDAPGFSQQGQSPCATQQGQSPCATAAASGQSKPRLREQFPFLSEAGCPVELQALVTRKITRYHEYTSLYAQLRDCESLTELSTTCGKLLDAYLDNQAIFRELQYYQKHRKVLGRHPFFKHFQQLNHLRSMSVRDLVREEQKTKDNIWRVRSEMQKGDKPHLDEKRLQKLQQYELKLQEIHNLLGE